ncbi:MAG: hypothetical protein M0P71_11385 [Melioribacteraceae bacterium]|nr:hypothetical protein [Melioribacteraceae bacterium]
MPGFKNHLGCFLSIDKIQFVEIVFESNAFHLGNLEEIVFENKIDLGGDSPNLFYQVNDVLSKFKKDSSFSSRFVSFSLSNQFFNIFQIPVEESLIKKDQTENYKWESGILFPHINNKSLLIQNIEVSSPLLPYKSSIVFGLNKEVLTSLNRLATGNNLELRYIDNAHISSNAFIKLEKVALAEEATISIFFEENLFSISLLHNNIPVIFKVVEYKDKIDYFVLKNELEKMRALVEMGEKKISDLYLFNELRNEKLISNLMNDFQWNVIRTNPFFGIKANKNIVHKNLYTDLFNSFTGSVGIALRVV